MSDERCPDCKGQLYETCATTEWVHKRDEADGLACNRRQVVTLTEEPLDQACPEDVRCWLRGIAEQTGKRQYWNAAYRCHQLEGEMFKAFGAVLGDKPDHFGHEPPPRPGREDGPDGRG